MGYSHVRYPSILDSHVALSADAEDDARDSYAEREGSLEFYCGYPLREAGLLAWVETERYLRRTVGSVV